MKKRIYRRPKEGILGGVAAGIGAYFDKDPVIVRLILVALALFTHGWPVLVAYVIAYFIIPVDPAQATVAGEQEPRDVTERMDSGQNM